MKRFGIAVLLASIVYAFSGCASTETASSTDSDVTTIPWNKPQSWEGKGPLGGFAPGGGY